MWKRDRPMDGRQDIAAQLDEFFDRTSDLLGDRDENTLDAALEAAAELDLPSWVVDVIMEFPFSNMILWNRPHFRMRLVVRHARELGFDGILALIGRLPSRAEMQNPRGWHRNG